MEGERGPGVQSQTGVSTKGLALTVEKEKVFSKRGFCFNTRKANSLVICKDNWVLIL